ncbi:MAG: phosphoglycerate kinase [Gemmatimonadales bacterium]|nr:phosphoglycerate kinase [Gemmatimonadales bacterium]
MKKLGFEGFDPAGGKVLMRVDFNVPLDKERCITDDTRIRAALPTINRLLELGAGVILMSHLGRPKGRIDQTFSLRPVADRLADLLPVPVKFAQDSVGPDAQKKASKLQPGEVLLLENLRFNPGETDNDAGFSAGLAGLGDLYVNDAFGTAHRAHASTVGVTAHFNECRAGLLMQRELEFLGTLLGKAESPFVAILGGAKVSGKVDVILNLLGKVDILILGGGMIFTFLQVHGMKIGTSLLDEDSTDVVKEITLKAKESSTQLVLPVDCIVAKEFSDKSDKKEVLVTDIPDGWMGLDIGSKTVVRYCEILNGARTVFWNGPMGVFELPSFAGGTRAVCQAVAEATDKGAKSVVGGGDSVAAAQQMGFAERISHISTGGGASLEFMAGRDLPGITALANV